MLKGDVHQGLHGFAVAEGAEARLGMRHEGEPAHQWQHPHREPTLQPIPTAADTALPGPSAPPGTPSDVSRQQGVALNPKLAIGTDGEGTDRAAVRRDHDRSGGTTSSHLSLGWQSCQLGHTRLGDTYAGRREHRLEITPGFRTSGLRLCQGIIQGPPGSAPAEPREERRGRRGAWRCPRVGCGRRRAPGTPEWTPQPPQGPRNRRTR